jgi:hypothetical protein
MVFLAADLLNSRQEAFDALPLNLRRNVFGVPYAHIRNQASDELFVTTHGWRWLDALLPEHWYHNDHYKRAGERLRFSTGTVYRVPLPRARGLEVVVKFSRVGQFLDPERLLEFPIDSPDFDRGFASPFEEIRSLEHLRTGASPCILAKRPLAIFSPGERLPAWQLGRVMHRFQRHAACLALDQAGQEPENRVVLQPDREYLLLFQWIRGLNLEECVERGLLDRTEAEEVNQRVLADLRSRGLAVLDHKPDHVIVRFRKDGSLLRRHGRVVYALADFELLVGQRAVATQPDSTAALNPAWPAAEEC